MSDLGFRPKGSDGPFYNPHRDLAYFTPEGLRGAVEKFMLNLDKFPEDKEWCAEHGITQEAVIAAFLAIAAAQKDFISASTPVKSLDEALRRHNFYDHPAAVRQFVYSLIGSVFFSAWFQSVRTVSFVGVESPAECTMANFSATVREFAIGMAVDKEPDTTVEQLEFENDRLHAQLQIAIKSLDELKTQHSVLSDKCDALDKTLKQQSQCFATRAINFLFGKRRKCRSTGCTKTRACSGKKLASLLLVLCVI